MQWCKRDDYRAVGLLEEDEPYGIMMAYCAQWIL
ncbi:hypothetical protein [Pantoea agglomerans]